MKINPKAVRSIMAPRLRQEADRVARGIGDEFDPIAREGAVSVNELGMDAELRPPDDGGDAFAIEALREAV